jgi:hypothetical protein
MPAKTKIQTDSHAQVLDKATRQVQTLYDESKQAMYLYLDDEHKSCSRSYAKLLGYASPAEWAAVTTNIPAVFVHQNDVHGVIQAFQSALNDGVATTMPVTWLRKDGKPVPTTMTLLPFDVDGHRLALHFIQAR